MYTKKEILKIAKTYLAEKYNCDVSDLEQENNKVIINKLGDCFLKLMCIEGRVIVTVDVAMEAFWESKIDHMDGAWFFQYANLKNWDKKLEKFGHEIADTHHYYLPRPQLEPVVPLAPIKWYERDELEQFRGDDRFGEALLFDEDIPDVLAVAAFEGAEIIGMAGATEDGEMMWQIGIDVLPEHRGKGIGANLIKLLKEEILKRGKVPFYGTVESHVHSQNIAINAGFYPVWAELYTESLAQDDLPCDNVKK